MLNKKFEDLIRNRPIRLSSKEDHKIILKRGFFFSTLYSIAYGFYEYFIVYNYPSLIQYIGSLINWIIMYLGLIIIVAFTTRYKKQLNIEQIIMGLFYMAIFEDLIFWIGQWIDTGHYPFPAGDWWDNSFASFRILGGIGKPIPFWPFVPTYYIISFPMIILYYISSYYSPIYSRITFFLIGPLFLAILAGTLTKDFVAFLSLIIIPSVSYCFIILMLSKNKWKFIYQ